MNTGGDMFASSVRASFFQRSRPWAIRKGANPEGLKTAYQDVMFVAQSWQMVNNKNNVDKMVIWSALGVYSGVGVNLRSLNNQI